MQLQLPRLTADRLWSDRHHPSADACHVAQRRDRPGAVEPGRALLQAGTLRHRSRAVCALRAVLLLRVRCESAANPLYSLCIHFFLNTSQHVKSHCYAECPLCITASTKYPLCNHASAVRPLCLDTSRLAGSGNGGSEPEAGVLTEVTSTWQRPSEGADSCPMLASQRGASLTTVSTDLPVTQHGRLLPSPPTALPAAAGTARAIRPQPPRQDLLPPDPAAMSDQPLYITTDWV